MTLAKRPQTQLTRLSDHAPKQEFLTGFGTTVTKVVDLSGGDPVQVTSINVSIVLGIVLGCAMSPAAIVTVPLALISGAAIVVNDLIVCSQYQASLEESDQYQSSEFWHELPEFVPNACADCQHFQSMRDRSQPTLGHCLKWDDSAQATEVCDDWQQFTITVPHRNRTILPAPIAQPEPTPIATPPVAKPVMVSRSTIEASADEELKIAQVWKAKPAIEPLSEVAAFIDKNLQNALQQEPRGFSNTVPEVVKASGLTDLEVIEYFKELSKKRPESYTLQRFGTMRLTVQGVA
jgi:hypothetical protein